ncbi:MAG: hypothetical protein ACRD8U_01595 [Pyrinomonadaceae bacterium]
MENLKIWRANNVRVLSVRFGLMMGFLVFLLQAGGPTPTVVNALLNDDAAFETEFQKGIDLLRRRQFEEALKSFQTRQRDARQKISRVFPRYGAGIRWTRSV